MDIAPSAVTTLRVYVAAIAAEHVQVGDVSLGSHILISHFMYGARRLKPFSPANVPSSDLYIVLEGLMGSLVDRMESASERILTFKAVLLIALTSLKRIGELQAPSVSASCMDFTPGLAKIFL